MRLHLAFKESSTIHNTGVRDSGNSNCSIDACGTLTFEPAHSTPPNCRIQVEAKVLAAIGIKEIDI